MAVNFGNVNSDEYSLNGPLDQMMGAKAARFT